MTRWQPHIDLARLLGALDREIRAASDEEVRKASANDRRAMRATADKVRRLIADVADTPDGEGDPEAGLPPLERREHRVRQH